MITFQTFLEVKIDINRVNLTPFQGTKMHAKQRIYRCTTKKHALFKIWFLVPADPLPHVIVEMLTIHIISVDFY